MRTSGHKPVLLHKAIDVLKLSPGQTVVDGTLGGGGHTQAILRRILPNGVLIAIDKDISAIERGKNKFANLTNNIKFVHDDFKNIKHILTGFNIKYINAAILDLGVSSYQLDEPHRGFSYTNDAPLDMRMDKSGKLTASEVVNGYTRDELFRLIKEYGEEKWAARIAEKIVTKRLTNPITTTWELVNIIKSAIPKSARIDGPHPAKRTFQAIRIEVNGELEGLSDTIINITDLLHCGGRFGIITFHSLEDRIVKKTFKKLENPCECPPNFPMCICGRRAISKIITKKPILPTEEEIQINHRARSAKLRVIQKV